MKQSKILMQVDHTKDLILKRSIQTTSNIDYFHRRFSVISALRSHFKLKIFNCSHRYHSGSAVRQSSMIEVVILENCFIMFHYGLVHYGTPC